MLSLFDLLVILWSVFENWKMESIHFRHQMSIYHGKHTFQASNVHLSWKAHISVIKCPFIMDNMNIVLVTRVIFVAHLFSFFVLSYCVSLGSVLWRPLRFTHRNDVRFAFAFSVLWECLCFFYIIFVCLHIVASNTYCVVFLFCFFFVLCTLCFQFLWIVHFWLPLRYSLTFIC